MLLFWIWACHWNPPSQTDRNGMTGVVVDAAGAPVAGLDVFNLESSVQTDADGRFGLYYKRPDLNVYFTHEQVKYWRVYRDEDEGRVLRVQLPETSRLDLDCGGLSCRLDLKWDLGEGLAAKVSQVCDGDHHVIHGPRGTPEASCRAGTEVVADAVRRDEGTLVLLGPERSLALELDADGDPGRCTATIGEASVPITDGHATLPVRGGGWLQVTCDGRPALPIQVALDATELTASWSAMGPTLQPPAGVELPHLSLTRDGEPWTMRAVAGAGGVFELPPLPAGTYQLLLHQGEAVQVPTDLEALPRDALAGRLLASGAFVARLVLGQDAVDGVVEPSMKETP